MNPVIKFKRWKRDRERRRLAYKIRRQVSQTRVAIGSHATFVGTCPSGDIWCEYLDALEHAGKVLNSVEKNLLERLRAVS